MSNLKKLYDKLQKNTSDSQDFLYWKPKEEGTPYKIRILPPKDYPKSDVNYDGWFKRIVQHYIPTQDFEQSYYICPSSEENNRTCPICSYLRKLWKNKDRNGEREKNIYTALKGREKFVVNILVRDLVGKKNEEGNLINPVKLFQMPETLMVSILNSIFKLGWGTIWDLEEGFDLVVIKNKKVVPLKNGGQIIMPDYSSSNFERNPSKAFANEKLAELVYSKWYHNLNNEIKITDAESLSKVLKSFLDNYDSETSNDLKVIKAEDIEEDEEFISSNESAKVTEKLSKIKKANKTSDPDLDDVMSAIDE